MCRMADDIKRFSTVRSCRSFDPRDSVPARWPFQKNPVPRGRHHSARPPYEVVGAILNRASSARATPPPTALCSTMPTTSSSSRLLRHLAQDRCPVRLGPGVRRNALFRGCPPLLELALIWTAAQMSAFRWRGGGPLGPAKRSACVTKAARVASSFDDVRDAWR